MFLAFSGYGQKERNHDTLNLSLAKSRLLALDPELQKYDAKSSDGRYIKIKLTGGNKEIRLSREPDYLIVLQLDKTKGIQEIYNGPGPIVWK